jgi:hypothetical protein
LSWKNDISELTEPLLRKLGGSKQRKRSGKSEFLFSRLPPVGSRRSNYRPVIGKDWKEGRSALR